MTTDSPKVKVILYDESADELPKEDVWLRIVGRGNPELLKDIGELYDIHELTIYDTVSSDNMPKFENHDEYSALILKTFYLKDGDLECRQLNIVFGKNFIITVADEEEKYILNYIKRLEKKPQKTLNHVIFDLLDNTMDYYDSIIQKYQDHVDDMEDAVTYDLDEYEFGTMFKLRRQVHVLRRMIRPVQYIVEQIKRSGVLNNSENDDMSLYLKDLLERARNAISVLDGLEESILTAQAEVMAQLQYKLSRRMNFITTASVIFMPLMVITGIYGMNFHFMPELESKYGYPMVLGLMLAVAVSLFYIFKRRKLL